MNRDLYGFLIGLGAGVGIGMLLAPRSGEKTRELIREKATDGASSLRQRGTDARDAATEAIREGTQKIAKHADAVKAAVDAGKHAFADVVRS